MHDRIQALVQQLSEEVLATFPDADLTPVRNAAEVLGDAAVGRDDDALERIARAAAHTASLRLGPPAIAASLLAPCVREQSETMDEIRERFGEEIASLVDGVVRLTSIEWGALARETSENLRRMFMAMAADVRVVLLMLAERVETMRALRSHDDETRQRAAEETLDVFAPLANRLGVFQLKWELEDLALRELEPQVYADLKSQLAEKRTDRLAYVDEVKQTLGGALRAQGVDFEITGRPKHLYSIYKKMQRKRLPFEEIYDVLAVRVLVGTVPECYAVLGHVHGLWTPIAGEFDDYIARPKANMYQSLHTAVVGPGGKPLEVQIRTRDMHQFAEYGVAAHWAYKEGRKPHTADKEFNLLRQLMDWQQQVADPEQFAATLRSDIFQDRIYVFTPAGDVIDLPVGATPLDFAYRVHTQVGHRCKGAKVNGHMVPLDRELQTGDRVEVLTRKRAEPSRDWVNPHLGYLRTTNAKQKVRQWFRAQGRDEAVAQGREMLAREFERAGVEKPDYDLVALGLDKERIDDVYALIGFGELTARTAVARTLDVVAPPPEPEPLPPPEPPSPPKRKKAAGGVRLDGVGDVMSQTARCCGPVPGDDVMGFITRGRGIMIHRRDCPNVVHAVEPERLVEIDWGRDRAHRYPVTLRVSCEDRPGVFRDVADVVSSQGLNLRSARTVPASKSESAAIELEVEVSANEEIFRVMDRIEQLGGVAAVRRVRS